MLAPSMLSMTVPQLPASLNKQPESNNLLPAAIKSRLNMTHAGFVEAVQAANASPIGQRNGGSMLSAQGTERGLLQHLLARIQALDPDVLIGHNLAAFDMDVLLHRLQHHKVGNAAHAERLRMTNHHG